MDAVAIRALIFDFGGVFTRAESSLALLRSYDRLLGLAPDTLHLALFSGEAWEQASTGKITPQEYWQQVGKPFACRLPAEFLRFRTGMFAVEPIDEGMVALARRLRRTYPLALCSNALHDLSVVLEARPDVRALFDVVVVSVQVGLRKPDPAIFHLTADRLGLPVEGCLLVDDKERNTAAAIALGMPAITFRSIAQLEEELRWRGIIDTPVF